MLKSKDITFASGLITRCIINKFVLIRIVKFYIVYIFCFIVVFGNAQRFHSRSSAEKKWAIAHPLAAIKVKKIYKKALPLYQQILQQKTLDNYENGGKMDAFRHVFFMAAFTQKIKPKKIFKLGLAHEKGNHQHFKSDITEHGEIPDSLSSVMDIQNNRTGIDLGIKHKQLPLNELAGHCLAAIIAGNAVYFKRNSNGNYLTCNSQIIHLDDYKQKWFIPKCLIATNE